MILDEIGEACWVGGRMMANDKAIPGGRRHTDDDGPMVVIVDEEESEEDEDE